MSTEGQNLDQKSLRYALGKHDDADGLACDCVGFANATGGTILLGIEDVQNEPLASQRVEDVFPDRMRKRLAQITVNVGVAVRKVTAGNGGEFVEIQVFRNEQSIAATSDGRLKDLGLVNSRGKTKATEYFVEPQVLRTLEFQGETTLKGIERHRLRELILRDLEIYRKAGIREIHERIGNEIPRRKVRRELAELVAAKEIGSQGVKRGAVYVWTK